ncbi:MAG: phosphoribosylformylglycinamidine synthase I [Candidatus Thorarchaeota archaeon]
MVIAVCRFPATNNESDVLSVLKNDLHTEAELIPHFDSDKIYDSKFTGIIIPGGFSYGDYLRPGAIASATDLMNAIKVKNREEGCPILGICNGFQILTESKMLPGVLLKNKKNKFISTWIYVKSNNSINPLLTGLKNKILHLPIAHFDGRYWLPKKDLEQVVNNNQVLFNYSSVIGELNNESNPNGSIMNIAGISNENYTVFGLMPHPERASRILLSSIDGLLILKNFLNLFSYISV